MLLLERVISIVAPSKLFLDLEKKATNEQRDSIESPPNEITSSPQVEPEPSSDNFLSSPPRDADPPLDDTLRSPLSSSEASADDPPTLRPRDVEKFPDVLPTRSPRNADSSMPNDIYTFSHMNRLLSRSNAQLTCASRSRRKFANQMIPETPSSHSPVGTPEAQ
jgi:hypothetical protein